MEQSHLRRPRRGEGHAGRRAQQGQRGEAGKAAWPALPTPGDQLFPDTEGPDPHPPNLAQIVMASCRGPRVMVTSASPGLGTWWVL